MSILTGLVSKSAPALNTFGGGSNTPYDLLNPSTSRLSVAGLLPGGATSLIGGIPNIGFQSISALGGAAAAGQNDWRVRVSLSPNAKIFYQDSSNALQAPLQKTSGVIWPYTPTINISHNASYSTAQLTHSNYPAHFYNYSEVADIQISGDFTVQNMSDGQYLMAVVYFFRSATKMFFGQGANVGNPPPIVFLDGYGSHYFPHVPCVVTSFQHTLPNEVDYVQVPMLSSPIGQSIPGADTSAITLAKAALTEATRGIYQGGRAGDFKALPLNGTATSISTSTRVPTQSTVSITLRPMYSRSNLHNRFDLDKFAAGQLLQTSGNTYGGFL
jgi:hypothetical protein